MKNKQIKLGALISYFALAVNIVATLIYMPWMVSAIGKADYALYTLATTFISIFMVDFGLSSAVSRFISKYNAEHHEEKINKFISNVEKLYLIIGFFIFLILFAVYFFLGDIYTGLSSEELSKYKQLYIIVSVYSLISFPCLPFSGILNAYEFFIQQKLCDLLQKLSSVALTVFFLLIGGGVNEVVLATVISGFAVSVAKLILIIKKTPVRFKFVTFDKSVLKEVLGFSIWITVISLCQRCIYNLAPSILGIVSNSDAIAVFSPANTLENSFYMLASAVNGLFLPTISRYLAGNNKDAIYSLMVKVGRYQFIILGLVFVGFFVVGKDFILAWMGKEYLLAYPCTLLLFIPDILLFTQQIANTTAIAQNLVKKQSYGYIAMANVCVILSFCLCPKLGVIGSAISIAVSYVVLFIYMNRLYYKDLGINVFNFYRECYFNLMPSLLLSLIFSFVICKFISFNNLWLTIILKGIVTLFVYCFFLFWRLTKEEKCYLLKVLEKKRIG